MAKSSRRKKNLSKRREKRQKKEAKKQDYGNRQNTVRRTAPTSEEASVAGREEIDSEARSNGGERSDNNVDRVGEQEGSPREDEGGSEGNREGTEGKVKKKKLEYKIKNEVMPFPEGQREYQRKKTITPTFFEPIDGEKVVVTLWVRYPDYDFIFGYPDKSNWRSEKECAFWGYRDSRTKKKYGFYFDEVELNEMIEGYKSIRAKVKAKK